MLGYIWIYLDIFRYFRIYLATFVYIWIYLDIFGSIWFLVLLECLQEDALKFSGRILFHESLRRLELVVNLRLGVGGLPVRGNERQLFLS